MSIAHRARLRIAPAPPKTLGGDPVAFLGGAARERKVLELVELRLVAQPELDGVDIERRGQLIHGGFDREHAARLARCAHIGRRVDIQTRDAMTRVNVNTPTYM